MGEKMRRMLTGVCTYCDTGGAESRDHVLPSSWYLEQTPPTAQRWTVPSCKACSNRFSLMEQSVGIRLVGSLDSDQPGIWKLWQDVSRSARPSRAADEKDRRSREKNLSQLLGEGERLGDVPLSAVLPHSLANARPGALPMLVDAGQVCELIGKIVRGAHWKLHKEKVSSVLDAEPISIEARDEDFRYMTRSEVDRSLEPNLHLAWIREQVPTGVRWIYYLTLWQQVCFRVSIARGDSLPFEPGEP
jgi:hypothetical protein